MGALLVWSQKGEEAKESARQLVQGHPQCADALYLEATILASPGQERVKMLERSLELFRSAEAFLALGQELIRMRKFHEAIVSLTYVLKAPVLFNEYWGYHGWAVTHAELGLAWAHFKAGQPKEAGKYFRQFSKSMLDPGPWHDLTQEEESWKNILQTRLRQGTRSGGK